MKWILSNIKYMVWYGTLFLIAMRKCKLIKSNCIFGATVIDRLESECSVTNGARHVSHPLASGTQKQPIYIKVMTLNFLPCVTRCDKIIA
jgi:hypothetical protein